MRVKVAFEGEGTVLDAADPSAFIEALGSHYVGADGDRILVQCDDGSVQAARDGWYAVVLDDGELRLSGAHMVQPA